MSKNRVPYLDVPILEEYKKQFGIYVNEILGYIDVLHDSMCDGETSPDSVGNQKGELLKRLKELRTYVKTMETSIEKGSKEEE